MSSNAESRSSPVLCHGHFCGAYYDDLEHDRLAMERVDPYPLNFDFGLGSPDPSIDPDTFSVYWYGNFDFQGGVYEFSVTADDGVQLTVDSINLIDKYFDQAPTTYTAQIPLSPGIHTVEISYYENGGGATLKAFWSLK